MCPTPKIPCARLLDGGLSVVGPVGQETAWEREKRGAITNVEKSGKVSRDLRRKNPGLGTDLFVRGGKRSAIHTARGGNLQGSNPWIVKARDWWVDEFRVRLCSSTRTCTFAQRPRLHQGRGHSSHACPRQLDDGRQNSCSLIIASNVPYAL